MMNTVKISVWKQQTWPPAHCNLPNKWEREEWDKKRDCVWCACMRREEVVSVFSYLIALILIVSNSTRRHQSLYRRKLALGYVVVLLLLLLRLFLLLNTCLELLCLVSVLHLSKLLLHIALYAHQRNNNRVAHEVRQEKHYTKKKSPICGTCMGGFVWWLYLVCWFFFCWSFVCKSKSNKSTTYLWGLQSGVHSFASLTNIKILTYKVCVCENMRASRGCCNTNVVCW